MSFLKDITKLMKSSLLCVGLDSDYKRLPEIIKKNNTLVKSILKFNKEIIEATHDLVIAYKLNTTFYSGFGIDGLKALRLTNQYIKKKYPEVKLIADCKVSEMGRGAELAGKELFEEFLFDAFTLTPWFGYDTVKPYLSYKDKAVFVLCHDSNPSAVEIQDVKLQEGKLLYEYATELICKKWNIKKNIFIEAGLTYPYQLKKIREISGDDMIILSVGFGPQGGRIENIRHGLNSKANNLILSASRSIIFASQRKDFSIRARESAEKINSEIYRVRREFVRVD